MIPDQYFGRLSELLQKKKGLLGEILELTGKQTEAITEDGLDSLNKLIDEKQQKIDAIDKLDEEFQVYFQRLKSTAGISGLEQLDASKLEGVAAEGARQLKGLTAEIMDIIRAIGEIEKENSEKSQKLLSHFSGEIRKINLGKHANNAYKPAPYSTPSYFLDKKK